MTIKEQQRREMTKRIMPVVVLAVVMGPVSFFSKHLAWPLPLIIVGTLAVAVVVLAVRALLWIRRNRGSL